MKFRTIYTFLGYGQLNFQVSITSLFDHNLEFSTVVLQLIPQNIVAMYLLYFDTLFTKWHFNFPAIFRWR